MCLAIPGKVMEIEADTNPVMAKVSFGGVQKRICLEWLPEAGVGDYVLVHVGFAISRMDEQEALETLSLLNEMPFEVDEAGFDEMPPSTGRMDKKSPG
ncbi:MAG TPA: HypC/HybG/HupF family hydrogenase formation chaperone [Bacteroidota bacterium]|nr:HypC/HybG/HupF family hydrogenase formation chaperone [Bacteroidota bacterium]